MQTRDLSLDLRQGFHHLDAMLRWEMLEILYEQIRM